MKSFCAILAVVSVHGVLSMVVPARVNRHFPLQGSNDSLISDGSLPRIHQLDIFDIILKANSKNSRLGSTQNEAESAEDLFQGDILITEHLRRALKNSGIDSVTLPPKVAGRAVDASQSKWPVVNGLVQVPYVIEQSILNRSKVLQAMRHWTEKVPCITFVPRTTQPDYLSFFSGRGCFSWVGRIGGKQRISIGPGCFVMGVIAHEIAHALGFWHEQSRPDRDNHVRILWNNIQSGKEKEFVKIKNSGTDDLGVSYDLASLMHYGPKAFSKSSSLNTIESLDGSTNFGQRNGLSDKDIEQARLLYCQATNVCLHKDKYSDCPWWAGEGYCRSSSSYYHFMKKSCKRSCYCSFVCEDKNTQCPLLASMCTDRHYKKYMSLYCKKSCNLCTA